MDSSGDPVDPFEFFSRFGFTGRTFPFTSCFTVMHSARR
jgi:hypothetical protein